MYASMTGLTDEQAQLELANGDERIVKVEMLEAVQDIGAAAAKLMPASRRYRYSMKVRYTSSTGKTYDKHLRETSKPKLAEEYASEQRYAAQGMIWLTMNYDKSGYSISHRMVIGH